MKKSTLLLIPVLLLFIVPGCAKEDKCTGGVGGDLTIVAFPISHIVFARHLGERIHVRSIAELSQY